MEKAMMTDYERNREERIKANMEAMRKLGIANLSRDVKTAFRTTTTYSSTNHERKKKELDDLIPPLPPRRSRRLRNLQPVVRIDTPSRKMRDPAEAIIILDKKDMKEEFYTDEHEMLGSCELPWALFVDGYNEDGTLMYDVNGKTCHQCRLKTVGYRTNCSKCQLLQGQFCGDCLYMRYGENILEAIKNSDWICPVCRDICNCCFCRLKKGWDPTGPLYKMFVTLGYKSVAHYLIQTRRKQVNSGEASSSKNAATIPDNSEAARESQPKPITAEQSDDSIIVVSSDESSASDDGESKTKRCRVNRDKEEGHCGNFAPGPGPGPISSRLRSRQNKCKDAAIKPRVQPQELLMCWKVHMRWDRTHYFNQFSYI